MPKTFWLVTGYACNNRCGGCYALPRDFKSPWMNPGYASEVMATLKESGSQSCLLIGGEPTLYPHLLETISVGSRLGLKMVIISNGRRFSKRSFAEKVFEAGLDRAVISIEGSNAGSHNRITGAISYDETVQGIRNCSELGKVNTLTTISVQNADEITHIVRISHELGVSMPVLNCSIPVVSSTEELTSESLDPRDLVEVVEKMFQHAINGGVSFQLNATFPLCMLREETLVEGLSRGWISVGCQMYHGHGVVFDPYGNILPCTHFADMPLLQGVKDSDDHFLLRESFEGFWSSSESEAGKFRNELWRYPSEKCKHCEYWGGCIGGCPLLWSHFDPQNYIV